MTEITALIPTHNNELNIVSLIKSLSWVDSILVVDSFSTDNTVELARSEGARVVQRIYKNSADQKNWALQFISTEWTLQLDTDEFLESGAEDEILKEVCDVNQQVDCFRFRRKNHMWDIWVKYGGIYPDYENRLFRTKSGRWFDRDVHSNIRVSGQSKVLNSHIMHYGMPSISKQLANLDRYTSYEANELGKKRMKYKKVKLYIFPALIFMHRYFYLRGYKDKLPGFILAVYTSFYYFVSHVKFYESNYVDRGK